MPRKIQKSREERSSEEFFPVDEDDLKRTTQKEQSNYIPSAKTKIEKEYKGTSINPIEELKKSKPIKTRRRRTAKKPKYKRAKKPAKKTSTKIKKTPYKPPKISLKKDGYELIITEKPQAAVKIASALGKSKTTSNKGVNYYEVDKNNNKIFVACAVGHLFTLHQNKTGSNFPVFDISWEPNFLVRKNAGYTKKYFDTIKNLVKGAGEITVATDYDVEGEVIGMNIVKHLCGQKDAHRMKFSTLTPKELNDAYEKKSKTLNWGQAIAGETRHFLDWFYGINLSRALMNAIKTTGRFKIMSIGRVQGPALNLIVKKEKQIKSFKSKPYWQVFITVKNGSVVTLQYNKDIFNKKELEKFKDLVGKNATATTEKKEQTLEPPVPFNLTTLQTEAYKLYGIKPSRTLQIAQSLYLAGLISYPRTSSQKLPESIGYKEIRKKLAKEFNVEKLMKKEKPMEGKKSDPAHPSIYPTGNFQILSSDDEKIYNLIVRRFLSLFCENAKIERKKIKVTVDKLLFTTNGSQITKKAWLEIYPTKIKEESIPDLDGVVKIIDMKTQEKETQPPRRYSPASIISELEKRNLGTKATRSSILETLYDRGYVKDTSISATPLGISLIETLEKYSPIIIDENLTRNFETQMESIQNSKSKFVEKEEKIIEKAKETITKISDDLKAKEKLIGKDLVQATDELREQQRVENTLRECPTCKLGNLIINYSKKTRRYFVACDAYPKCTQTYSLPPNGVIKKTDKTCPECGWPIVMRLSKGKRPWEFCFNPDCITNREWAKKREEYKEENKKY